MSQAPQGGRETKSAQSDLVLGRASKQPSRRRDSLHHAEGHVAAVPGATGGGVLVHPALLTGAGRAH